MKHRRIALAALTALALAATASPSRTYDSFREAKAALDASVDAYGGIEHVKALRGISFRLEGESIHRNQSRRPGALDRTPYSGEVAIDIRNSRFRETRKGEFPGGIHWHQGTVIENGQRQSFDLIRKTLNPAAAVEAPAFRANLRWLPQLVLLEALERAPHLRHLGQSEHEGRAHDVLHFLAQDGTGFSLHIERRSRMLSKIESLVTDRLGGDAVVETIFAEQEKRGGWIAPGRRITKTAGAPTTDLRLVGVAFDPAFPEDAFRVPAGLRPVTFPTPPPVTKYSDRVHTVNAGGYNVLVVEFDDHLFVMEAPGRDSVSVQAIERIRQTVPGKPIRYLAVSHHHDDHAGGIRAYVAEGATLIVAPGEKAFFEDAVRNTFLAEPDTLARRPRPAIFEPLRGRKRVLTDGVATVELLDIGPSPHAEEMLVAYLPREKILYQGDLANRPPNGDPPLGNATMAHFAKWIDASGLDVEKIVPVHGPVTTLEEVRKALAETQSP